MVAAAAAFDPLNRSAETVELAPAARGLGVIAVTEDGPKGRCPPVLVLAPAPSLRCHKRATRRAFALFLRRGRGSTVEAGRSI